MANELRKNMTFTGIKSISELVNNRIMLKYV
jgi:isopentenyl diphosphate isomerase/L-lactate dehydrogenase-like FMN-dependent dehydrogenase